MKLQLILYHLSYYNCRNFRTRKNSILWRLPIFVRYKFSYSDGGVRYTCIRVWFSYTTKFRTFRKMYKMYTELNCVRKFVRLQYQDWRFTGVKWKFCKYRIHWNHFLMRLFVRCLCVAGAERLHAWVRWTNGHRIWWGNLFFLSCCFSRRRIDKVNEIYLPVDSSPCGSEMTQVSSAEIALTCLAVQDALSMNKLA